MNLKDIIAISGESGLFRFLAQGRNAIIVEHLETNKRQTASASSRVSSLEDIAIYTTGEDLKLSTVFDRIYEKESGGLAVDPKSSTKDIVAYFESVLPEYDKNRVYVSDIKKVIVWYNLMHKLNLLIKDEPVPVEEPEQEVAAGAAPAKPAKAKITKAKTTQVKANVAKNAPPKTTTTKGRTKK